MVLRLPVFFIMLALFFGLSSCSQNASKLQVRNNLVFQEGECINLSAETFLNCELNKSGFTAKTRALWNLRVHEGKSSTFWSAIEGLRECDIKFAKEVGTFCGKYEEIAGNEVLERKTEFLVVDPFQGFRLFFDCKRLFRFENDGN